MTLRDSIERCYASFERVGRPQKLDASPLRDADEILRTLTSAPLRELSGDQIGPYSGWAITTVGDERDYRHFLPRIFELSVTDPVWLGFDPPVMASRLDMASWRKWPAEQQLAALSFFRAAFEAAVEAHPDTGQAADEWLCGLVRLGEPPSVSLEQWYSSPQPNAALQIASFVIREAKHLHRHGEVQGSFWKDVDEGSRRTVASLLLSDWTKEMLQAAATQVSEDDRFCFVDAALAELQRQL